MSPTLLRHVIFLSVAVVLSVVQAVAVTPDTLWLSSLDLTRMRQGWGNPQVDRSVANNPLRVGGQVYARGVGTHARSVLHIRLNGGTERFHAVVGVDDSAGGPGSAKFSVYGDGALFFKSSLLRSGRPGQVVDVSLRGVNDLVLVVTDGGDGSSYDHADWCNAWFLVTGEGPRAVDAPREEAVILTPPPPPAPRIHAPAVYGCRPGNPFLFRIPCTGERPITFRAADLPGSLHLDATTGIVTGDAPPAGDYVVDLSARNRHGEETRRMTIRSGELLACTPPMGWNHWYAHYGRITDGLMREAADVMVSSGMADVGYQYVNIDDCWMNAPRHEDSLRVGPLRDAGGNILPNRHFPDMKGLTDYIHAKGLKAGIYTSPGSLTCAGFAGSYQHEVQDARQFAQWGFDFLKYDWCSYNDVAAGDRSRAALMKPYDVMGKLLRMQRRDIVFNLCQYGMGEVWEWGASVGGHCWRTAGDLGFELDRVFDVALANAAHRAWSGPGSWNDPDYIQIGYIGDARKGGLPAPCAMGPNEQYSFMSLWCLMAAPLFFSGDMGKLDPFTLNVLCNPEVIAVDQDPLGQCAAIAEVTDETFLMVKNMADGSTAVGMFNRGEVPASVTLPWSVAGLRGTQRVRDLWRQRDLGVAVDRFTAPVPRHGVVFVRLWPEQHPKAN